MTQFEKLFWNIIVIITLFIIQIGCSDPDNRAEALLDSASKLVISAIEMESESYSEAYKRYTEALDNLETIINECPSSYLASAISKGELNPGEYSYNQLRDKMVPLARLRAVGERDPLFCALYIYCELQDEIDKDFLLVELSKVLSASGRYDDAIEIVQKINEPFYKIRALNAIAKRILDSGDQYKALGLLSEAYNMALNRVNDSLEKVESLASIGCLYAMVKGPKKADKVFSEAKYIAKKVIKNKEDKVCALAQIASKLSEAAWYSGFWVGAIALVKELKHEPFVIFMHQESVIRGYIKSGKYDEAIEQIPLLEKKLESIFPIENRDKCIAKLACIYAELHKSMEAEQYTYMVKDPYLKEKAMAKIAGIYAGSGQFETALEKAQEIKDLAYKASALIQIVIRQPNCKQMVDEAAASLLYAIITDVRSESVKLCDMEILHKFDTSNIAEESQNIVKKDGVDFQPQDTDNLAQTPEEAVKRLFRSAISDDIESMKRYLITTEYILRSNPEQLRKLFVGFGQEELVDVKTFLFEETDYTAKVFVEFIYKDRTDSASKPINLEYKDGGWKIIFP